jgi:predicted membrane channel-forming protein YqfA (hemolysin III family)
MMLVAVGWLFVVGLYAIVQWVSPQGSALVALLTLFGLGLLPLAVLLYVMAAPNRRRRRALEASAADPHAGRHAAGDAVAAEREET